MRRVRWVHASRRLWMIAPAHDEGTVRLRDNTFAVVLKPAETISELSTFATAASWVSPTFDLGGQETEIVA